MRIFLIRHGEAVEKDDNSVLTEKGIEQSRDVAKFLKKIKIDKIFVSGLTRAKQTLEEYKKLNPKIKVEETDELNEIYRVIVGGPEREGTPKDREEKDKKRADRIYKKLIKIKGENIAVFTHGNIIRYFLAKVLNKNPKEMWEKEINLCSISVIEVLDGKAKLID